MSLFDLITKSDYEIETIGNHTLPCTIMRNSNPMAILMPDLSLRMVSGQEKVQPELDSMVQFSLDNQGMEHFQDGYKLSQYKNVYLTTTYDLENHKPLFNVYQINDKSPDLLFSSNEQAKAAELYAQRSGLIQGEVLNEQQQAKESRLQNFLRQLQTHGFHVQKAKEKEHRYEIMDKNGKSVGFIGTDNRAVITSDDFHERRRLTNLYQQSNEPVASQPPQLSRWRQLLQNLGYSVRMFFSRSGTQVDIQDTQHHDVASIADNQEIHFTEQAAAHDREQLSSAQEEIRKDLQAGMEQQAKESRQVKSETVTHEAADQHAVEKLQAKEEEEKHQEQQQEQDYKEESLEKETPPEDGVFLTAAEVQALSTLLYENRGLLTHMDSSLLDKLSQPEVSNKEMEKAVPLPEQSQPVISETHQLNRQEQAIQANFQKAYQLLQTMQGFESPQALSLQNAMMQDYGTISPQEFQKKLEHGEYAGQPTLEQQLHSAKREAQQVNNSRTQPQQEHTQERGV